LIPNVQPQSPGRVSGRGNLPLFWVGLWLWLFAWPLAAQDLTNAIRAYLEERVDVEKREGALVVGLVDEHGTRVISCGKLDNNESPNLEVNGDTLFELGSVTKTFTGLLLEDMVERGEMKWDDPVTNYLPPSVKVPAHNGRQITLLHLATHTSGLPFLPSNAHPRRLDNPYAEYTPEKLYAFLAGCRLTNDPGTKFNYSDVGMMLLGHAIERRAGTNYESLLIDRICRPLHMDSTLATLTPDLKARLAGGHGIVANRIPAMEFQSLVGSCGLHSSANDLLKYVAANLGLVESSLTPAMRRTHVPRIFGGWSDTALAWETSRHLPGVDLVMHNGMTYGHTATVAFDLIRRRGVVVLSSSFGDLGNIRLAWWLLEGNWNPKPVVADAVPLDDGCIGQYEMTPNWKVGWLATKGFLGKLPKRYVGLGSGVGLAILVFLWRWSARSHRWVRVGLACLLALTVIAAAITPMVVGRVVGASFKPHLGIRREQGQMLAQLAQITVFLRPESKSSTSDAISGIPLRFIKDGKGKVNGLCLDFGGWTFPFHRTSDSPPDPPTVRKVIKLDPKLFDGYLGRYEFPPDELFAGGLNVVLRRQGDQIVADGSDKNGKLGTMEVFPTSETNFVFTAAVEFNFTRDAKGQVTNVVRQIVGWDDCPGKRVPGTNF
jgi:CubicO group peptidase (beta-lactamase class C family)